MLSDGHTEGKTGRFKKVIFLHLYSSRLSCCFYFPSLLYTYIQYIKDTQNQFKHNFGIFVLFPKDLSKIQIKQISTHCLNKTKPNLVNFFLKRNGPNLQCILLRFLRGHFPKVQISLFPVVLSDSKSR